MEENKNIKVEKENNQVAECEIDMVQALNNAHDRIEALEKELEQKEEELKQKNNYHLQYYRQADILKKTLKAIIEKHDLKMGDVYELMLETNEMDMDTLLLNLSK